MDSSRHGRFLFTQGRTLVIDERRGTIGDRKSQLDEGALFMTIKARAKLRQNKHKAIIDEDKVSLDAGAWTVSNVSIGQFADLRISTNHDSRTSNQIAYKLHRGVPDCAQI